MIQNIIMFFKNAFSYTEDIKLKNETIMNLSNSIYNLQAKIVDLNNEIESIRAEKEAAKEEIAKLLFKEQASVQEFKAWYISRMGNQTWTYDWDRKGSKPVEQSFRYKDKKTGPAKLTSLANKIISTYKIKNPTYTELIEHVKTYFTNRNNWTYVYDHQNPLHPGMDDYWQEIDVSIDRKRGDCEDLAILMHVLIKELFDIFNYSDYKWRLWFTAGRMLGYGGHAYNIWLHDDGQYYGIESTFDLENNFRRAWLNAPIVYNNLYVDFWGFATPDISKRNFNRALNKEALRSYGDAY